MFYYLTSLVLNLSPWVCSLFLSSLEKLRRSPSFGVISLLLVCFGLWPAGYAHPAQIGLQWDASADPDVSGYKIYFGTSSRNYGSPVIVGNTTSCTISNLSDGVTYYFAATAMDSSSESDYSNEVVYTTPSGCTPSLSAGAQSFGSSGGLGSVVLATGPACSWTALSNVPWIILTSNSSGTGGYTFNYSVSANSSSISRSGTLTIAGQILAVTQSGVSCSYSISPGSRTMASSGGTGTVSVTASAGCSWTASSSAGWITINSGNSGSGSGSCGYTVAANTGSSSRTGSLTVAGQTFTVTQSGVSCTYSISPTTLSVGSGGSTGTVSVTAVTGCSWSASSSAGWITINSGNSGSGSGSLWLYGGRQHGEFLQNGVLDRRRANLHRDPVGSQLYVFDLSYHPVRRFRRVNRHGVCHRRHRMFLERLQQHGLDLNKFREQRKRQRCLRLFGRGQHGEFVQNGVLDRRRPNLHRHPAGSLSVHPDHKQDGNGQAGPSPPTRRERSSTGNRRDPDRDSGQQCHVRGMVRRLYRVFLPPVR